MSSLVLRGIGKSFGGEQVLRHVSLEVGAPGTLAILGRSGSGKTTLLRIIAGLERPDHGQMTLDGEDLVERPVAHRNIVHLSQIPLLFPHLDVRRNLEFGLRVRRRPETEIRSRVDALLERLELAAHAHKRGDAISGGQRQRVAFGRALVVRPAMLLLDEPFSALDPETRSRMQTLFLEVAREEGIKSMFVTHDLREALTVGDRFAYLERGSLTAYASRSDFVADPRVGARDEISFWRGIESSSAP